MPNARCISPSRRRRRDTLRDGVCPAERQAGDDVAHYQNVARICERALLDVLFLADSPSFTDDGRSPTRSLDPVVLIPACALATEHLGLVLTASTTFSQPYNLARSILTLDQVSRGRVGWNIVTTADAVASLNFGTTEMPSSDLRYEMAADFTAAVRALWDSWDRRTPTRLPPPNNVQE